MKLTEGMQPFAHQKSSFSQSFECHCSCLDAARKETNNIQLFKGRVVRVVRALPFHQCGPGLISALSIMCGLSLLFLNSALRGFSSGTPVFRSHQKPTFDLC